MSDDQIQREAERLAQEHAWRASGTPGQQEAARASQPPQRAVAKSATPPASDAEMDALDALQRRDQRHDQWQAEVHRPRPSDWHRDLAPQRRSPSGGVSPRTAAIRENDAAGSWEAYGGSREPDSTEPPYSTEGVVQGSPIGWGAPEGASNRVPS